MPEILSKAWAEQVLEEHRELRRKKSDLRDFLEKPRPETGEAGAHTWAAGLARQLVVLHDELFRHFRFEEEGGMAEEIITRHPRATAEVERLMGEHAAMLREVRELMDEVLNYSEGQAPEEPSLRQRIGDLLNSLDRHESEEDAMIHDLELLDLGVGE